MLKLLLFFIITLGKCDRITFFETSIFQLPLSSQYSQDHSITLNFVSRFLTVQISVYWANFTKSDSKVKDKSHKFSHRQTLKLQRCDCTRSRQIISLSSVNFSNTSCGRDAYMRGPHQKVVSFSFYGNKSSPSHLLQGFFEGMNEELKLPPAFILCRY